MNIIQKKRGLGKGLSDLGVGELINFDIEIDEKRTNTELKKLPIEALQAGRYQPRRSFSQDALNELAESIQAQGVIQPIIVRPISETRYEIIAGERRWRAAQIAGLREIPVIIQELSDEAAIAIAIIENIQRQDLNAIEEAQALQRLITEFSMTHEAVAKAVGKSRAAVTNILRLLKLSSTVRTFVEEGHLEMGHARALLTLENFQQVEIARKIIAKKLSVREAENLVKAQLNNADEISENVMQKNADPNVLKLQRELSEKLGAAVNIRYAENGKGKLIINYHSLEELEGILAHII